MKKLVASFVVNGRPHEIAIESHVTLADVLRNDLELTGTKQSCGIGNCGACTVLVEGTPVLSCLTLAVTVRDKHIITIEGIAKGTDLHPIQKAFVAHGAIQCGYCTPAMILAAKALLEKTSNPSREEVKNSLSGNLCRCTGYVKIIDAVMAAAKALRRGACK